MIKCHPPLLISTAVMTEYSLDTSWLHGSYWCCYQLSWSWTRSAFAAQLLLTMGGFTAGLLFSLLVTAASASSEPVTCSSEGVECKVREASGCSLAMDGELSQSVMLTSFGETSEISVSGFGPCDLTFLIVGSGGRAGYNNGGGGGSGYLQYRSIQVPSGTLLTAQVGQSSSLTLSNGDTVTAHKGQIGGNHDGGDGYCGGGGDYGGDGGSDGRDGQDGDYFEEDYTGGTGTGEDISLYTFNMWTLSPGAGGHSSWGGGGGGVLVDGAGPESGSGQGAGYGGGGSGHGGYGLPGVILIEVN